MKYLRIVVLVFIGIIIISLRFACQSDNKPLTKAEIEQSKKDSIKADKERKIDYALTELKELTLKKLKDPDSFEMIDRVWDKKDSLKDNIKLLLVFRANNSFGGKTQSMTKGTYNCKTGEVKLTEFISD